MTTIVVRDAVLGDIPRLGIIHIAAWQAAYVDIMPDGYLAGVDPAEREANRANAVERNPRDNQFL